MAAKPTVRKTVSVRGRTFHVDGAWFAEWWDRVAANTWEPATFQTFERHALPGSLVVDIGAWVGATVLYAAAGGADVITFEPDPVAHPVLKTNVGLNPEMAARIEVRNVAVGTAAGELSLFNNHPGNSGSSLVPFFGYTEEGQQNAFTTVQVIDGRAMLEDLDMDRVSLIKIDIEGAEYDLIPHIAPILERYRPALHLSFHPFHIDGVDEDEKIAARRAKTLGIAEALAFYDSVAFETEDGARMEALDGAFADRAIKRPFPRQGWVFTTSS